eukprot:TRINITY_DN3703_c0_g1_i1.p1 TRINITY_DN3703_c0_g1~~TRINITY_DN3703_c0_g1_i1.p1  ORF type:complete len:721 (+),score=123.39 TRINITY_DN3703_c0_g1_i1:245-2164(+)
MKRQREAIFGDEPKRVEKLSVLSREDAVLASQYVKGARQTSVYDENREILKVLVPKYHLGCISNAIGISKATISKKHLEGTVVAVLDEDVVRQIECCRKECWKYFLDRDMYENLVNEINQSNKQRMIAIVNKLNEVYLCNDIMELLFGVFSNTISLMRRLVLVGETYNHNNVGKEPVNKTDPMIIDDLNAYISATLYYSPLTGRIHMPPHISNPSEYWKEYRQWSLTTGKPEDEIGSMYVFRKELSNIEYAQNSEINPFLRCDTCAKNGNQVSHLEGEESENAKRDHQVHLDNVFLMYQEYLKSVLEGNNSDHLVLSIGLKSPVTFPSSSGSYLNHQIMRYFSLIRHIENDILGQVYIFDCYEDIWECAVSCLEAYFEEVVPHIKGKLTIWSDSTEKLKNQYFLGYLCSLIEEGRFTSVEYNTLETGHSNNITDQQIGNDQKHFRRRNIHSLSERMREMHKVECVSDVRYIEPGQVKDSRGYLSGKYRSKIVGNIHHFVFEIQNREVVIQWKHYKHSTTSPEVHHTQSDKIRISNRVKDLDKILTANRAPSTKEIVKSLKSYIPLVPHSHMDEFQDEIEQVQELLAQIESWEEQRNTDSPNENTNTTMYFCGDYVFVPIPPVSNCETIYLSLVPATVNK